jgi:hypothetical protein
MIKLKHDDLITFGFISRYNGMLEASYRVRSAISEALEAGADPGRVQDKVALVRINADPSGIPVQTNDLLLIEGKYFTLALDGDIARIDRVGAEKPDKPA